MERLMEQILFELKEMRVDLNEVKQSQKQLESDVRELRASQKQLESDVRTLQEAVAELQEGQARVEQTIGKLSQSIIDSLAPYFDQITQHIDERYEEIHDKLHQHERMIETLSYRSLSQETELKDLKRMMQHSS
ncbi:hypothetical protein [Saccharococcus caldoxylosilyticus]|uniref:hypothetical protein n=1 Tax=Saccharococcus caldoxylosilyticus TaxID=81408 RepID=UPI001FCC939F|nr:hypothetical protein [Parageobacillus caldoxylosilyticus]BDG45232.1 hypothetical protein PcaKH35_35770 [Parageobacillus caldoxylosilyticus]